MKQEVVTVGLNLAKSDYNEVRPHSSIGNKPPISLVNRSAAHGPPWPAGTG